MAAELQIQEHESEGIRILDLQGPLTIGSSGEILRAAISALAQAGAIRIVLNLLHVPEMDADGLGALISCQAHLLNRGGSLKLWNLRPNHLNLMIQAKMDATFEIYANQQDAIDSFFPDRQPRRYDILEFVREQEKNSGKTE